MSKIDVTTQDIFLQLDTTSMSRSAKADALFRRLRMDKSEKATKALQKAPRRLDASDFIDASEGETTPSEKERPKPRSLRG